MNRQRGFFVAGCGHCALIGLWFGLSSLETPVVVAQSSGSDAPTFEVVSIRPSQPDERYGLDYLPTRFEARAATVERLILTAYGLHRSQIAGGPDWIHSDRFTIVATLPEGAARGPEPALARIRALLRERFGLRTHTEMREAEVYELLFARPDQRLGPGLRPSTIDCEAAEEAVQKARARGELPAEVTCRLSFFGRPDGSMVLRYGGRSMSQIAQTLSPYAGRMVVDKTGLTGLFDMEVAFASDPEPGSDAVSIFTAAQGQLGLRLDGRRSEISTLVIDSVARPSPN